MFHGAGCTEFTQVNETHLHARLDRLLIQLRNEWSVAERERFKRERVSGTPKLSSEDFISLVLTAWGALNHRQVAQKGYLQTGPGMALQGDVRNEDVFYDLRHVLEASSQDEGRTLDPTFADMAIRDEAVAFVKQEWAAGRINKWADAPPAHSGSYFCGRRDPGGPRGSRDRL